MPRRKSFSEVERGLKNGGRLRPPDPNPPVHYGNRSAVCGEPEEITVFLTPHLPLVTCQSCRRARLR